ncbi:MAG TPA: patatin-like protein [Chlorobaculum sp.]|nr:patatin-like protein [Chlorobaculum sp.]
MHKTQEKITKEIRFAVVMYGGVSLAVYMNGIAQELLNMVRSTSLTLTKPDELTGTASVYRNIATYLSAKKNHGAFDHRFVVDIISGTSAGGINGVCLAKALVRGLGGLKALEKTWLNEGDIDKLLNDRNSQPDRYPSKEPKTSLFNSQRMYAKLLDAFKEMESTAPKEPEAPDSTGKDKPHVSHISAMDLFVTATDLRGLQLPVLLSDGKAFERRHKHVFPFVFRSEMFYPNRKQNHFTNDYDPMLAFASRCTSSFPTAFEPVTIDDVMQYLAICDPKSHELFTTNFKEWERLFFSPYTKSDAGIPLLRREFADGGYLDNRPFGHAIDAIHEREAYCPVDRKLLYIDPVPEVPDTIGAMQEISFVKNSVLASFSLPGYETIREELDALRRRNDWIDTVNGVLVQLEKKNVPTLKTIIEKNFLAFCDNPDRIPVNIDRTKVKERLFALQSPDSMKASENADQKALDQEVRLFWKNISSNTKAEKVTESIASPPLVDTHEDACRKYELKDLDNMIKTFGSGYTSYHFTRLSDQTDILSRMIVKAMDAQRRPDIVNEVNELVKAWRTDRFASVQEEGKATENIFFRNFDIDFRIRRLNYLRNNIEKAIEKNSTIKLYFDLVDLDDDLTFTHDEDLISSIMEFHKNIVDTINKLYRLRALLLSDSSQNPLAADAALLRDLIKTRLEKQNQSSSPESSVDGSSCPNSCNSPSKGEAPLTGSICCLMEQLRLIIKNGISIDESRNNCEGTVELGYNFYDALETFGIKYPDICGRIWYIYDYGYDLHDFTKLTLLAGGEYGEGKRVDVYRISPADAVTLWDESAKKRSKLAGIALSAFGGFLDREWRRNDILWGRLDAVERIISALLPNSDDEAMRTKSILNAQHTIIDETTKEWMNELEGSRFSSTKDAEQYNRLQSIRKLLDSNADVLPDGHVPHAPEWKTQFSSAYDFHRDFEPEPNLRRLGRSSAILSSMIDRLDGGKSIGGKISGYLKKLNWVLLGMLDFSTPKSLPGVLFHYWLQLIMLVSISLIAGSYVLGSASSLHDVGITINRCGWVLLFVDLVVWFIRQRLETTIHKIPLRPWIRKMFRTIAAIAAIAGFVLLILVAETLYTHGQELLKGVQSLFQTFLDGIVEILKQHTGKQL